MLDRFPQYEDASSKPELYQTIITLTIAEINSVKNWYENDVKDIVRYLDFDIFVAADPLKDCKQQCVEFLGGTWNSNKLLIDMIPQSKIIRYLPINGVKNVSRISDFVTDDTTYTNDCKNVARIVETEGHMGVISRISQSKTLINTQKKKYIYVDNDLIKRKEIFIDIESFTYDNGDKNKSQIPYLICWSTDDDNIEKSYGKNCIENFFNSILKNNSDQDELILYAWYGSGYDYQHLLPYIKELAPKEKIIIKNNSIIYAEFYFELLSIKIVLKDPFYSY